jgi:phenylacetic acid degradation protein paaN
MSELFEAHRAQLEAAVSAARTRGFWSAYPESARAYGEAAPAEGKAAFEALLGKPFELEQPSSGWVGEETSPYGLTLGVTYPAADAATLAKTAEAAAASWAKAPMTTRVGVCLEIVKRINAASFLIAHAVEHTTGQAFAMAFQAGGPHAQDRALEAIAYAYDEMSRIPGAALWEKPAGKNMLRLDKAFTLVPRGVGLVIGCATFPTWNGYPAIFADLATGNAVIVKPHPGAVLPLAISVKIGRDVLKEQGFDPNLLLLAADSAAAPLAKTLAERPEIGIVDYTGSSLFGGWLRENLKGKLLFTEEAGVNSIVIESTDNFAGMCQNIAFSLSLYSGQMCTAPQAILVPKGGIQTEAGSKSFDEVAAGITGAVDALLSDHARAAGVLGAIQNPATIERIAAARGLGKILRDSNALGGAARTATPLILAVEAKEEAAYLEERFGPISFIVATEDAKSAVAIAAKTAKEKGAITAALYSTDDAFIDASAPAYAQAGVALSVNLTGGIYVNQSAAFSDYHVSGSNPAGNACLTDAAFVANRFSVLCVRRPAAA